MYSRKIALSQARQIRTCPPPAVIQDAMQTEAVNRHVAICPHCAAVAIDEMDALALLSKKIGESRCSGEVKREEPVFAGQIRAIRPEKAAWREDLHYNPPLVLVLEVRDKISDDIRVAQIYEDTVLAAPGDLILSNDQTGAGDLFVECWNTYTLKVPHLGILVGRVAPEMLSVIQAMAEDPDAEPDGAPLLFPMRDDDPRIYFRRLEVETAFTFSSQAAEERMRELEAPGLFLAYASSDELKTAIAREAPGIEFSHPSASLEETLLTARFPADRIPLAAADDSARTIIGRRVAIWKNRIVEFEPLEIEVFEAHGPADGIVGYSGRIPLVPPGAPPDRILCRFAASADELLAPAPEMKFNVQTGAFFVCFATALKDREKLLIALIHQTG